MSSYRNMGRFARDRRGVTAVIFAICFVPMILMVGFGVDYTMYLNQKQKVQEALDMAGLAAARHLHANLSASHQTVEDIAQDYFDSELAMENYISMTDVTLVRTGMRINLDVDGTMPTSFSQLAGIDTMPLDTDSEVIYGVPNKAEIVLVLDTSTSMSQTDAGDTVSRIASLKQAAKDMVSVLLDPASTMPVDIAIVPFSNLVNVGMDQSGQLWLSEPADYTLTSGHCHISQAWYEANCVRDLDVCGVDGVNGQCGTWDCSGADYSTADQDCTDYSHTLEWFGCVQPRSEIYHLKDADYYVEKIPGIVSWDADACASPILPLTDDKDDLDQKITNLSVRNETYIPSGLIWGLRMLTHSDPFPADHSITAFAHTGGLKSMILMSDGANTLAPDASGEVSDADITDANPNTEEICETIKKTGVELYVVAYNIADVDTTELLYDCASSPTRFYEAGSADELKNAFAQITKQLARDIAISG